MTQTINPDKLKAAAEHLEWVLNQYPNETVVQGLHRALLPQIEDAKAERVLEPVSRKDIPGRYNFGDGIYRLYENPNVENAYVDFVREMRGGLTEQEKSLISDTQAIIERKKNHG